MNVDVLVVVAMVDIVAVLGFAVIVDAVVVVVIVDGVTVVVVIVVEVFIPFVTELLKLRRMPN